MTKKFAIIGKPIAHSLSPFLHNYWFKKYNINSQYSLMDINEGELENVARKIRDKELVGINITLPFKQKIIPNSEYLRKLDNFTGEIFQKSAKMSFQTLITRYEIQHFS